MELMFIHGDLRCALCSKIINLNSVQVYLRSTHVYDLFGFTNMAISEANKLPYSNWLFCRTPGCYCADEWAAYWLRCSVLISVAGPRTSHSLAIIIFIIIRVYFHSVARTDTDTPSNRTLFISRYT